MKGFIIHADGRLRAGRAAMLTLVALMIVSGLAFKLSRPVSKKLLAVRHVFESTQVKADANQKPVEKPAALPLNSLSVSQGTAAAAPSPGNVQPGVKPQKKTVSTQSASPAPPSSHGHRLTPPENPASEPSSVRLPEKAEEEHPNPVERTAMKEPASPDTAAEDDGKENEEKTLTENSLDISRQLAHLSGRDKAPQKKSNSKSGQSFDTLADRLNAGFSEKKAVPTAQKRNEEEKEHASMEKALPVSVKPLSIDPDARSVTVSPQQYVALFHDWRKAGGDKEAKNIPFRVENLRGTFDLFQMKPVAVVNGDPFFELVHGGRIASGALSDYSDTVFLVDGPWDKWGGALTRTGIGRDKSVEVRYYMYGFIKNAIYARIFSAYEWCKQQNLIPQETLPSTVDILGRAYAIQRDGGGRFGVFVPVLLETLDGRRIAIDPACFQDQSDVMLLRDAGLL